MGGIIGVGIFFTPHSVAQRASEPWAFIGLWVVCGLVAMCAAFTFAELGATFPKTGGWFVYLREAFGRYPAFLFAWVVLGVVSTGATAGVAMFGVSMLHTALPSVVPDGGTAGKLVAVLMIVAITCVGLAGVKRAAVVQNLCMVTKLLAILALVVCGFAVWNRGGSIAAGAEAAAVVGAGGETSLLRGIFSALLPVFFAYGGWQMVGYIAPEVKNPTRTIPRAIVFGVFGVIVVYVLVNLAYLAALGIDGVAANENFATILARDALGSVGERVLAAAMAISALGWCVVGIITAPWLYVAMAREGLFFSALGKLNPRTGVPTAALVVQGAVASAYLFTSIDYLVDAVVFVEWFFHGLVALALLRLRRTQPGLPRPYTSPFFPLAPVVYTIAATAVVFDSIRNSIQSGEIAVTGTGLGTLAVGSVVFLVWRRSAGDAHAS